MMKILKEAITFNASKYKSIYKSVASGSDQSLKRMLVDDKNSNQSNNNQFTIKEALINVAAAIDKGNRDFPATRGKFLTKYLSNVSTGNGTTYTIDFKKLVKDPEFNLLSVLGLLSVPLYRKVLAPDSYRKFLSMFSEDGNFNNLSYILLGEFTEAFDVDNISKTNELINVYLNTELFTKSTKNRKQFEKVYNSYVNNSEFDDTVINKALNPPATNTTN